MNGVEGDFVLRVRDLVCDRWGLRFDDGKISFLEEVLGARLAASGLTPAAYFCQLAEDPSALSRLAPELTVAETYFFRNREQFLALREVALPEARRANAGKRSLRLLSAGCATGEEAYSIAIVVREALGDAAADVAIRAVDVNPEVVARAGRGRYSRWALRETSAETLARWFCPAGREFLLDASIREAVRFDVRNLLDPDEELWRDGGFDVIFCRNVLMYLTPQGVQRLVDRFALALAPHGFLFLGHAETLRGVSPRFHLRHTHGTFYYQLRPESPPAAPPPALATTLTEAVKHSGTWVEAISDASARIHALTARAQAGAASRPRDLAPALALVEQERFEEALELVESLEPGSPPNPDALLLRAVLLVHRGRLEGAEQACRRLLAVDEMSAGAHYVLALCREGTGDSRAAAEHDQVAAYLDPSFAMPRLHLGLLARRAGDPASARRELEHAQALLLREEVSRLILFGGGFDRRALVALCRAELAACEVRP